MTSQVASDLEALEQAQMINRQAQNASNATKLDIIAQVGIALEA